MSMKVVVAGATGFIGEALVRALLARGDEVVALTRDAASAARALPAARAVAWRPPQVGDWAEALPGADGVVNLAGAPVAGSRWTAARKATILGSRVEATRAIVEALARVEPRPPVLVNASAVGYYGDRAAERLTEASPPGRGFLAEVCRRWEAEARRAEALGVRVVLARTGIVLGRGGGALPQFALPFRFFAGGPLGDPNAWVSWIHQADETGLLLRALTDEALAGPVNLVSPNPVQMDVFAAAIGRALGRPSWLPVPPFLLRAVLGELYEGLFPSLRVYPRAAERAGYRFSYPDLDAALREIVGSRAEGRGAL